MEKKRKNQENKGKEQEKEFDDRREKDIPNNSIKRKEDNDNTNLSSNHNITKLEALNASVLN